MLSFSHTHMHTLGLANPKDKKGVLWIPTENNILGQISEKYSDLVLWIYMF